MYNGGILYIQDVDFDYYLIMKIMEIIVSMFYSLYIVFNSNFDDIGLKYNKICYMIIFYFKDMFKNKK